MLKNLEILGLRGFAKKGILSFAEPNGEPGSGLTIIVGANNSGKSTIIEALRALGQGQTITFSQGKRNILAGDLVELCVTDIDNHTSILKSIESGNSETNIVIEDKHHIYRLFVLPSRRNFNPHFSRGNALRDDYMRSGFPTIRTMSEERFPYRLFHAQQNKERFNNELRKVLDPVPQWSIDQYDTGEYYLKITNNTYTHSSEGLGEGLISLLYIIDSLYDSQVSDTIAIDEPELSLHPALQRKLMSLFADYSKDRQIILSTHSPYFIDFNSICNGGSVARVYIEDISSVISQLNRSTIEKLYGIITNDNNPHILGLNAQEVFFMDDGIILVEGQEDVIFFQRILNKLNINLNGNFLGWGVGGAGNMETFVVILKDLGFKKVVGIFDNDKREEASRLQMEYPDYNFISIPANDVRTKPAVSPKEAKPGLLDDNNSEIRPEYIEPLTEMFNETNEYLSE